MALDDSICKQLSQNANWKHKFTHAELIITTLKTIAFHIYSNSAASHIPEMCGDAIYSELMK